MNKCIICGKKILNYKPEYCCNDRECGCQGLPIEPPLCENKKCQDHIYGKLENNSNTIKKSLKEV